jgi:L-fuconolactonase
LQAANITERLEQYKLFPVVKGFRHVLQGEPQRDRMLQPDFKKGIAALQQYNFTYDILIFPDQIKFSTELVALFPEQKFIIDHIAKPYIKRKEINEWKKDIKKIALYQNVYCKNLWHGNRSRLEKLEERRFQTLYGYCCKCFWY